MIDFKTGRKQKAPQVFANVEEEQFFVSHNGELCQKIDWDSYSVIADVAGNPYANRVNDVSPGEPVDKILPRVTKITFPGMGEL